MNKMLKYRIQSAGAAYTLENIAFVPETIEVWNYTKWASDATKVKFYWHRGMADGYALSELCSDTEANRAIEAANGFTIETGYDLETETKAVSGITAANPPVATVVSTTGWTTGDQVMFHDIGGMVELNGNTYKITVINGTTFSLQTLAGDNVDATGYTAFAAGTELNYCHNLNITTAADGGYNVLLGSTVMGANDDVLFVEIRAADQYVNVGDVA